jgi:hypothetical protein
MSTSPSSRLAEVQAAFVQWRQSRTGQRVPLALRRQAVALLADHRISEVMGTLRVDHRALTRWRRELSEPSSGSQDGAFIELPVAGPLSRAPASSAGVSMTLTRQGGDGSRLSVSGQLSEAQWRWALALLQEAGR